MLQVACSPPTSTSSHKGEIAWCIAWFLLPGYHYLQVVAENHDIHCKLHCNMVQTTAESLNTFKTTPSFPSLQAISGRHKNDKTTPDTGQWKIRHITHLLCWIVDSPQYGIASPDSCIIVLLTRMEQCNSFLRNVLVHRSANGCCCRIVVAREDAPSFIVRTRKDFIR